MGQWIKKSAKKCLTAFSLLVCFFCCSLAFFWPRAWHRLTYRKTNVSPPGRPLIPSQPEIRPNFTVLISKRNENRAWYQVNSFNDKCPPPPRKKMPGKCPGLIDMFEIWLSRYPLNFGEGVSLWIRRGVSVETSRLTRVPTCARLTKLEVSWEG